MVYFGNKASIIYAERMNERDLTEDLQETLAYKEVK